MNKNITKYGDFSNLAENYYKYRPKYALSVLNALLGMMQRETLTVADVGAGTGIWTQMLADHKNVHSIYCCGT